MQFKTINNYICFMERKIRVSTYAKENDKTTQWAYGEIKSGKVKSEKIDGVIFVIVKDEK